MGGLEHSATPDVTTPPAPRTSLEAPPPPRPRAPVDPKLAAPARRAGRILTAGTALLALLGLAGWITGVGPLRGRLLELPGMKANTAVCLLLLSGAVWLLRDSRRERGVLPLLLAATSGTVALATLAEWVTGASFGIDQLLFDDPDGFDFPGRMSPQTAGSLLLLSGTVTAAAVLRCGHRIVQIGALASLVAGIAALVGLVFGVMTFVGVSSVIGTAVPTALAVIGLAAAVLLRFPDHGVVALLLASGSGGRLARLLIPLAVAFPLGVGITLFRMRRAGLVAENVAWSVFVLAGILLPAAVILWTAYLLERVDRRLAWANASRLAAEQARAATLAEERRRLAASEARARALIEHAPDAIVVLDVASGRFIQVNREAERLFGMSRDDLLTVGPVDVSPPVQPDGRPSAEVARDWIAQAVRGGTPTFEWEHWTASGESLLCEVRLLRLPDEERILLRGSLTDIRARRRAERQRQRLQAQRLAAEARSDAERTARTRAEQTSARQVLLQQLTAELSATMGVHDVAQRVVRTVTPALGAEAATVSEYDGVGTCTTLAATGLPEGYVAGVRSYRLADIPLAADVVASGRPVFVGSLVERNRRYPEMRDAPVSQEAWANLPLTVDGRVVGLVAFGWARPRVFLDEDVRLLEAVASQCAVALHRARLFDAERAARAEAEEAQARLSLLADASALLAEATDEQQLMTRLADLLASGYADWCSVLLPDEQNRLNRWAVRAADPRMGGLASALERHPLVASRDDDPRVSAWRTGRPARVGHLVGSSFFSAVPDADLAARLRDVPIGAGLAVPLVARGERLGVLSVLRHEDRPAFSPADEQMLADLGRRAGTALDSLRVLAAQTRVAARLQETLLPSQLPAIDGMELAARYLAAEQAAEVGGDFYDAFPLADGEYALVIGDVSGRGVDAAGLTGLARSTLRALGADLSPAAALTRLNEVLNSRVGTERFLTAAYLRLRPLAHGADLTVAVAGHPLPLVLRVDGTVEPVGEPGTLLGVFDDVSLAEHTVHLAPGDSAFLYTDGVIEAHGPAGLYGEERLVELLADTAGQPADVIAARVAQAILAYRTGGADDLAVLVLRLRRTHVPGEELLVDVHLPAEPGAARQAREILQAATGGLLPDDRRYDLSVAVSELVANAVAKLTRSPTSLRPDPIALRAVHTHGALHVEVSNPGPGFRLSDVPPHPEAVAGRGLAVVRALTGRLGVDAGSGATRVWFEIPVPPRHDERSPGSALPPQSTTATRSPGRGT